MTTEETAWLAGILEGEGSFVISYRKGQTTPWCGVMMASTDQDVIEHVAQLLKTSVTGPIKQPKAHWKPQWKTSLARRFDLEHILPLLRPYMGRRRQAKIDELLEVFAAHPPYHNTQPSRLLA